MFFTNQINCCKSQLDPTISKSISKGVISSAPHTSFFKNYSRTFLMVLFHPICKLANVVVSFSIVVSIFCCLPENSFPTERPKSLY